MSESSPKRIPTLAVVIPALLVAWIGYLYFFGPGRGSQLGAPGLVGDGQADYNWKLRDLAGNTVDFASFKGKPVFLNIWATWCPPCVAELPSIASLAANPRVEGVAFLCV